MKAAGILPGNFYWFDNNWHYIRKWGHLKNAAALNNLNKDQYDALIALQTKDLSASDAIISRCVSTAISLLWTEEQIKEKGEKMVGAIKKALERSTVGI